MAVLNYTPGLSLLYKKYISKLQFDRADTKSIAIICWGFMKNDLSYSQLFESISQTLIHKIHLCNLTDTSLLLWSYCRFIPLQHRLLFLLINRLFEIINVVEIRLMDLLNDTVKYIPGQFITDVTIDKCEIIDSLDSFKECTNDVDKSDLSNMADKYIDSSGMYNHITN